MLGKLIMGYIMALNAGQMRQLSKRASERRVRNGKLPTGYEFVVGTPVHVRTVDYVRDYIRLGARGTRGSRRVQTLVRGHWKHQPCGTGGTDRKFIHIEPYWRGPEDAPIAVRSHILKGQAEATQ
jgi:hypothetical protein